MPTKLLIVSILIAASLGVLLKNAYATIGKSNEELDTAYEAIESLNQGLLQQQKDFDAQLKVRDDSIRKVRRSEQRARRDAEKARKEIQNLTSDSCFIANLDDATTEQLQLVFKAYSMPSMPDMSEGASDSNSSCTTTRVTCADISEFAVQLGENLELCNSKLQAIRDNY